MVRLLNPTYLIPPADLRRRQVGPIVIHPTVGKSSLKNKGSPLMIPNNNAEANYSALCHQDRLYKDTVPAGSIVIHRTPASHHGISIRVLVALITVASFPCSTTHAKTFVVETSGKWPSLLCLQAHVAQMITTISLESWSGSFPC